MRRIAVIINPISGSGGHRRNAGEARLAIARRVLSAAGLPAEVVLTNARGHGLELARTFVGDRADLVVAWGGDGTINEVAGPIIGTKTALGIVRSGSGDGLARSLRTARDPARALAAAIAGPVAAMDVGYLGGRHFLNIAGIGFDATIAAHFNRRRRRGLAGYATATLARLWTYQHEAYDVVLGEQRLRSRCFLVAFANGAQYGGNLRLSAAANPQDGWLDAVVIEDAPAWRQLLRMRQLLTGVRRPSAGIHFSKITAASVTGDTLVCHVDGETFEASGRVDVSIAPGAIRISGAPALIE